MFSSREEAGRLLSERLKTLRINADLVLGIPRGGVVIAREIAQHLSLPLDVVTVKKLGAPGNPELAIGALTYGDVTYIDRDLAQSVGVDNSFINQEVRIKHRELVEREKRLRGNRLPPEVVHKKIILTDDGIATGATVLAAIEWLKKHKAEQIILAIPVAPSDTVERLRTMVDMCVFLETPVSFGAVGQFYKDFRQVTDEEVAKLLDSKTGRL